jgi:20S proteasome alpha/beta subunit
VIVALRALKEAAADAISDNTCSVAIVGKDTPFRILQKHDLASILENLDSDSH